MTKTWAVASMALLAASLTGCGGGDKAATTSTDNYCDLLESAKDDFAGLDANGLKQDQFDSMSSRIDDIEAAAPDDVKAAWGITGGILTDFQTALSDAGLTFDDVNAISQGEVPEGVDMAKLQKLPELMSEITTGDEVTQAQRDIEASAQSECGVDLSGTSTSESAPAS